MPTCLSLSAVPGQVVVGTKTADMDGAAQAVEASGGGIVNGPYDDAHERRAVVYDSIQPVAAVACSRSRSPLARSARWASAARTSASEPTTRTLTLARVTAV